MAGNPFVSKSDLAFARLTQAFFEGAKSGVFFMPPGAACFSPQGQRGGCGIKSCGGVPDPHSVKTPALPRRRRPAPRLRCMGLFSHVPQTTRSQALTEGVSIDEYSTMAGNPFCRSGLRGQIRGVFHATGGRMLFATGTKGGVWHKKLWGCSRPTFLEVFFFL